MLLSMLLGFVDGLVIVIMLVHARDAAFECRCKKSHSQQTHQGKMCSLELQGIDTWASRSLAYAKQALYH